MKTLGDRWAWREPTAIMEDTQAINWEAEEEEETERHSESLGCILEPLGRLRIFSSAHGPEKDFPLYLGKNVVGRMPDCSVVLPFPSISKQHAVIEILAWNKAPVLQDCGSLNGTKILRPPKVLSPGVSHHLRDQELVVFADLPCQYHRLDVPLPFVSRGRLTVEETPREQGRTQPQGLLLAEDSEEEVDPLSERCVVKEPRTTSSPMATVVPESDEEGPSPPPDGPRPPLAFNLDSDTDKEEIQQPAAREASSAATAKTEQPKVVITEIHLKKDQRSVKEGNNDIKVKRDARNGVILERSQPAGEDSETDVDDESGPPGRTVEVHLERAQPSGSTDSDTDVEEEGVPATLAVLPVKKREIFYGVSTKSPGGAGLAHLQESPAGSYTDVEKGAAPLMVPQERNQPPIVIDSDTDDEEEVSAALALACLKESHAAVWNRDTDVKEARAQPLALLERSHTSAGTDSDTDVEEEEFPVEKRESVPKGDTDKAHSEKSQPLFRDCDIEMEKDKSSSGVHLEKSQASATVGMNTQVEEEVPPGPAVTLWEKHQVPVAWTNPTNVETEGDPAKLPGGQLEEARHPPGTPGEPTQPQRKGTQLPTESGREPHVDMTRDSGGNCDDSEDLDLQATQCFAETENQSLEAVPSIEDEPTQAFVPQEPGPSHCSFRDPGHLNYKMPPAEKASRGDPESLGAYLPLTQPEAAAPLPDPLVSQSQKHPAPQPVFSLSPPLELPFPRTRQKRSQEAPETALSSEPAPFRAKPKVRPRGSSRMTPSPVSSLALEPHPTTPTDQPISPEPTSWATRRRTHTSSEMTPAPVVLTAPELQSSTAEDQPVTPKNISQATQGRTHRSSVNMPVTPKRTSRGRTHRSSVKTPVTPKSISQVRTRRSSVKTPEPIVPTAPELQPSTPTDHPVTPKPTSRGRTHRPSIKTPEPIVPTAPELQHSTSTDQPVTPKPTSRGRTHRPSVKTPEPIVPTAPELQHSTSTDQPVTPKPTSRGRTHRSSVKTPEPIVPTAPELQHSTSTDQPVVLEPTSQATWRRTRRASVKTYQPIEPTDPDLEPSTPTDQPIPPEPIPQANCSRRPRATRKHGFLAAPIVHNPSSAPPEPDSRSSRTHRRGAVRAAESPRTPPEPAFAQLPEASTRAPQIQKGEAAGRHRSTPEPQAKASQNHKRPLGTVDSPPLQKRLRRGNVPQKTATLKEENVVMPRPGKRKRDQAEEEPKGMPGRSLRCTKPNHKSTAPKVLFTGVVDARGERAVLALGGSLASSVAEASYLVTDRIRRTVKFLCALGRGIPILSLDWLHQSHRAGRFLPPDDYVVTDPEQEKNFGFSLRDALSRAQERRLLEGYEIHVTPGVQPPPAQMGEIISCCGGTVLPSMPHSYKPQRVVVTCSQDVPRCSIPFRVGVPILSPEFLLTGVLKQEATPEAFVLSTLEMSTT
ncbi:PREDICTED: mediator of DNA damage checkpoint protein 1 isoform X6 [Hipposideros armiger]|uniref:Mediator of DNA damage checkpoint protein 1 n=1 Tax=Hipposideros armiger TaxID=186990 RepID=A0A8B7QH11_HIPAR|nr:PREDICTED: mediator of DNA damage checkpoint protein 1 isoform X6 [Hipposideros armiger]